MIVFVSGGARSGKSRYAEEKALDFYEKNGGKPRLIYAATALKTDAEMSGRIARHVRERSDQWETVEAPYHLQKGLSDAGAGDVVLVDCLTVWLTNRLYFSGGTGSGESGMNPGTGPEGDKAVFAAALSELDACVNTARQKELHVIFVSNDVNEDVPVKNEYAADYIRKLEQLHRLVVSRADEACQIIAGLSYAWKGAG